MSFDPEVRTHIAVRGFPVPCEASGNATVINLGEARTAAQRERFGQLLLSTMDDPLDQTCPLAKEFRGLASLHPIILIYAKDGKWDRGLTARALERPDLPIEHGYSAVFYHGEESIGGISISS